MGMNHDSENYTLKIYNEDSVCIFKSVSRFSRSECTKNGKIVVTIDDALMKITDEIQQVNKGN